MTKKASPVPMNLRASKKFRAWLKKERERRGLTNLALLDDLALRYSKHTKGAATWPEA